MRMHPYYPSPLPTPAWIASPVANVYHLFTNFMGDQKAPVSVTSGSVAEYNLPAEQTYRCLDSGDDIPYLTYTASTKQRYETIESEEICVRTAYIMLINQYGDDYACTVKVSNLLAGADRTVSGTWHVLKCWDTRDGVLSLDNVNGSDFVASGGDSYKSGRIRIEDIAASVDTNADGSISVTYPGGGLPEYSVAVLELTARRPMVTMSGPDRYTIPIGQFVRLTGWPVTAVFGDRFYLENTDKSSGIAVVRGTETPPSIGANVTVTGILTIRDGEQVVQEATVADDGGDPIIIEPLLIGNRDLGGISPNEALLPSVGSMSASGAMSGSGVYNVGLLVNVIGAVSYVDTENGYFYVNDGQALTDGTQDGNGSDIYGVRVYAFGHDMPTLGGYARIKGVSTLFISGTAARPAVFWLGPPPSPEQWQYVIPPPPQNSEQQFQNMAMSSGEPMTDQIDTALAQVDGTQVSLQGVEISGVLQGYFGVKDMLEVVEGNPRLLVSRTSQVLPRWSVDVQGTITTLASGQRAIVPASVWLYTDAQGRPAPPYACMMGPSWPHKQQIQ